MSEQRRNSLTSITTNKKEKKSKDSSRTVRFTLTLPEPNEETCPEFNYRILLSTAEKKRKLKLKESGGSSGGYVNGVDPLAEDDEDQLKEIARQFEAKYGGGGRKKHGRFEDYVDLGAGYDENDPFIDNTDAYDEVVPEEITTAHGGFYINCGALEFKEVSDQSDLEDFRDLKMRKRLKKPKLSDKRSSDILKKRKFASHEREILKKKKKRAIDDLVKKKAVTVKELLREKRESLEAASVTDTKDEPEPVPVPAPSKPVVNSVSKPTSTSISDVIESVISAAVRGDEDSSKDSSSEGSKSGSGSSASSDVEESKDTKADEEKERNNVPTEEVKLPDGLSDDIRSLVADLRLAAKTSAEGKCKFFSPRVNNMLLNVERKSQSLSCSQRQMVYGYLAFYLPCTKDTLMKRAKKLVIVAEENKLREPLRNLADAVSKIMPAVLEKYSRDCQKAAEEKNVDESKSSVSDSEGNTENKVPPRNPKIPRRIFPWTAELRELLREVIRIKLQCTDLKKSRKQSSEDILKTFLEKEVKPLWPPGWMKVTILLREGRDARTNIVAKSKKSQVVKKPTATASTIPATAAAIPSAASTLPTSTSVINVAPRIQKPAPVSVPTNGATVISPVSLLKNHLPSCAKPKHPSEVSYSAAPRTKASPISMPNSSARVHSPSSGVPSNITSNALSGNVHVSSVSSSGKLSAPSVPVKPKVNNDISVKTSTGSVSGKSSPTVALEKQVLSGVTVSKIKNGTDKGLDFAVSVATKSNAVPTSSTKVKTSSGVSITPVPMPLSSSAPKSSTAAALPLINIPDCISVTPSPITATSITATAPKPMSLKQRILHDSAKDRLTASSSVNMSSSSKLMDEGIEVIEIVSEKSKTESGNSKRVAGSEVPGKLKTEFKKKKKMENSQAMKPVQIVPPVVQERKPSAPVLPDKDAERKLNEETATATDILSQIINESLNLPSSNIRDMYQMEDNSVQVHQTVIQKRVSSPPLPVLTNKEDKNDSECAKFEKDVVQPDDAEESVQLEVDRVMKELRELQGHMSGENEPDTNSSKYSPPKISSSISVVPVNNVVSVRNQQQSKSTKDSELTSKPVMQARRTSLGGFQEEFQKHLFQDIPPRDFELPASYKIGKNKAVFPVPSSPKNSLNAASEDSAHSSINPTQHGSYMSSNSLPHYPKLPSSAMNSATANSCDRRLLNNTNSSILHMQEMKSNAQNSQPGVQHPTDDQFSLFQYIHSLSGSTQQHSPPY